MISPTNAASAATIPMNISKIQNSTLNLNNLSTNQEENLMTGMEMVSQLLDISNFNNTSCILGPPTPTNNNLQCVGIS